MPSAGAAGFAQGFARSFDVAGALNERQRRQRQAIEDTRIDQERGERQSRQLTEDRGNEALNAFDGGDYTPLVDAWNNIAAKSGAQPTRAAKSVEPDEATGTLNIVLADGTKIPKKPEQARALIRAVHSMPAARSAIDTETASQEDRAARISADSAMAALEVGNYDGLIKAANPYAPEGEQFTSGAKDGERIVLTTDKGNSVRLTKQQAIGVIAGRYGQSPTRYNSLAPMQGRAQPPGALDMVTAENSLLEHMKTWADLDPEGDEFKQKLALMVQAFKDPAARNMTAKQLYERFGIPWKTSVDADTSARVRAEVDELRNRFRSPGSEKGEAITAGESAQIEAKLKGSKRDMGEAHNARFFAIPTDGADATGGEPADQASPPAFDTIEDAEASGLPSGTMIIVGGRRAVIE